MNTLENATKFFTACEAPEGWAGCKPYVAEGATPFLTVKVPMLVTTTNWGRSVATEASHSLKREGSAAR